MHKASCLCGLVQIQVEGDLPPPNACHCRACRKHSGHYEVSVDVPRSSISVDGEEHVKWYNSSDKARRGFCEKCGSTLFWDPRDHKKHDWTAISMGAFDTPTQTHIKQHIFVSEKGDYYDLLDGLPQNLN